ncbi:MAG: holo-ACP synthase, partial [Pseudomonadota bacterium]
MIYGIGIDVVEPQRVARLIEKYGERFVRRVLTQREWPGYARTANPALFVANRFAAKEAFSKAMGTGFRYPVTLQSISVVQDRRG